MAPVNLYALLKVKKTATAGEIRKAYYALARKVHPDKNPGSGDDFLALKRAYDVLIDTSRRARYDRAGTVDEAESRAFEEAYERYKSVEITPEDMEDFVSGYKESEAEVADLVSFVSRTKGDVSRILEAIIGSDDFDPPRYVEIIEQAFRDGKILGKFRKKFDETKTAILSLSDLEGEDLSSSSSCSGEKGAPQEVGTTDLVALIAARRKEREQKFEEFAQKWQAVSEAENNNNNNNNPASSSSLSSKKRKRRRPKKKAP